MEKIKFWVREENLLKLSVTEFADLFRTFNIPRIKRENKLFYTSRTVDFLCVVILFFVVLFLTCLMNTCDCYVTVCEFVLV